MPQRNPFRCGAKIHLDWDVLISTWWFRVTVTDVYKHKAVSEYSQIFKRSNVKHTVGQKELYYHCETLTEVSASSTGSVLSENHWSGPLRSAAHCTHTHTHRHSELWMSIQTSGTEADTEIWWMASRLRCSTERLSGFHSALTGSSVTWLTDWVKLRRLPTTREPRSVNMKENLPWASKSKSCSFSFYAKLGFSHLRYTDCSLNRAR